MTKKRAKRKLNAIFSADVKGYSRLMGEDELSTIEVLKKYREVMIGSIRQFHGRVIDSTGDNLLAAFDSIVDAVESAVEIQKTLQTKNAQLPENRMMEFRIGINLGDIIEDENRIYGDGVNITARLESLAEGGGICISGTAYDQVKNKLSLGYRYLGEKAVKNITEPVRAYMVDMAPESPAVRPDAALEIPDKPSIAVLPFVNMSRDPEQEYFSEGLTEDIITDLSKISGLFVIARHSSFFYKGKAVKARQVAEELGVRYVLEGSVRKGGGRVRITTQLTDASTGGHLWAERFERELKDIFSLQDELTNDIVSILAVKLGEDEHKRLARRGTNSLEAYDYLLRGAEDLFRLTKDSTVHARQLIEKSIETDPGYALAYALLAWTFLVEWTMGWARDPDAIERGFEFAQKAISLDDAIAETHWVLGNVYLWKKQHEQAVIELEKGIAINPNSADCYATLGNVLTWDGRLQEAVEMLNKAMRLNPYYPAWYLFRLGQAYGLMERYDESIEAIKTALERDQTILPAMLFLSFAYERAGRLKEARAQMAEFLKVNPDYTRKVLWETAPVKDPATMKMIADALKKAGLP